MNALISAAPTTADIEVHGAEAMLIALRAEFTDEHRDQPAYTRWADGALLVVARTRITGAGYLFAEPGDLLLVRRDPCRDTVRTLPPVDLAWSPRAFAFTRLEQGDADDVVTGRM